MIRSSSTFAQLDELQSLARPNEAGHRLWRARSLRAGLEEMLRATIELLGADKGNVQVLDGQRDVLHIVAYQGFEQRFLDFFREVSRGEDTACGRALRTGEPILIEDVMQEASFQPFREEAFAAGFRAVVSMPLIGHDGKPLGILSSHFRVPGLPTEAELHQLQSYGRLAAAFLERWQSEDSRLRENEERLRLATETAGLALWDLDLRTGVSVWNEQRYRILGYKPGEIEPGYDSWMARVHPDDRAAAEAVFQTAMQNHEGSSCQYRIVRPDGEVRWVSAKGRFLLDDAGRPARMISAMHDVSDIRLAEQAQQVLIHELQHRTRNMLAVVQATAEQTSKNSNDVEDFMRRFDLRLMAMSRVQDLLSRANLTAITLDVLIAMELEALCPEAARARVTVSGPEVRLRDRGIQMMALAIHELTTNALKHGALSRHSSGQLAIHWRIDGEPSDPRLLVEWLESGIATLLDDPGSARSGYGRALIENALPYSLGAQTTFTLSEDTLRCSFDLSLNRLGSSGR